jgi:TP901 family phage tail tape measure protein
MPDDFKVRVGTEANLTGFDRLSRSGQRTATDLKQAFAGMANAIDRQASSVAGLATRYLGAVAAIEMARRSFTQFASVDLQLRRLQVQAGATFKEVTSLMPMFEKASYETGNSVDELITGFDRLRERSHLTVQETAKLFPAVVSGAYAANVSITNMADALANMMTNFRISGTDAQRTMDILFKGTKDAGVNIGELSNAMPQLTAQMAEWGVTGNEGAAEMIGLLRALRDAFPGTGEAATALLRVYQRIGDPQLARYISRTPEGLRRELRLAQAEGKDVLAYWLQLIQQATAHGYDISQMGFRTRLAFETLIRAYPEIGRYIMQARDAQGQLNDAILKMRKGPQQSINELSAAWGQAKMAVGEYLVEQLKVQEGLKVTARTARALTIEGRLRELEKEQEAPPTGYRGEFIGERNQQIWELRRQLQLETMPNLVTPKTFEEWKKGNIKPEQLPPSVKAQMNQMGLPFEPIPEGFGVGGRRYREPEEPQPPRPGLSWLLTPRWAMTETEKKAYDEKQKKFQDWRQQQLDKAETRFQYQKKADENAAAEQEALAASTGQYPPARVEYPNYMTLRGIRDWEQQQQQQKQQERQEQQRQRLLEEGRRRQLQRQWNEQQGLPQKTSYTIGGTPLMTSPTWLLTLLQMAGLMSGKQQEEWEKNNKIGQQQIPIPSLITILKSLGLLSGSPAPATTPAPAVTTELSARRHPGETAEKPLDEERDMRVTLHDIRDILRRAFPTKGGGNGSTPTGTRTGEPDYENPSGPSGLGRPGPGGAQGPVGPATGRQAERIATAKAAMKDQLIKEGVPPANAEEASNLLAGQALAESGMNPRASHDSGTGYGIYGARLGRRDVMLSWMRSHGYPPDSLEGQARYMAHEAMSRNYPRTRAALMSAEPGSRVARTNVITREFEAPRVVNPRTGYVGRAAAVTGAATASQVQPGATGSSGDAVDDALKMEGLHERKDRDTIKQYLRTGGQGMDPAVVPWCAAFVSASLQRQGIKGAGNWAANYYQWGQAVKRGDIQKGDVIVSAGSGPSGTHVGLATGQMRDGQVEVLAGNVGDRVERTWKNIGSVVARRATPKMLARAQARTATAVQQQKAIAAPRPAEQQSVFESSQGQPWQPSEISGFENAMKMRSELERPIKLRFTREAGEQFQRTNIDYLLNSTLRKTWFNSPNDIGLAIFALFSAGIGIIMQVMDGGLPWLHLVASSMSTG